MLTLVILTMFGFAQAKAEYLYKVVIPDIPIYLSEGDTFEGEINTAGGTLEVYAMDGLPAGTLLDSDGYTVAVTSQGRGEESSTMIYTYEDLAEGQYVYTLASAPTSGAYSFSFEQSQTGGGGGDGEAEIIFFNEKYNIGPFQGFKGQFTLYSSMTISVLSNVDGELKDSNGKVIDWTNMKYGNPQIFVYANLPEGDYTYEFDGFFNMDGTTLEFQYGEAEVGSGGGSDDDTGIEFGKTYELEAWDSFEGSFFNFDNTTLHVYATNGISGDLLDGNENEVALLNTVYDDNGVADYSYNIGSDFYTYRVSSFGNMNGGTLRFVLGDGDQGGGNEGGGGFEGTIELGKTYELTAGNNFSGDFTVDTPGVLTLTAYPNIPADALYIAGPTSTMTQVGETETTEAGQMAVYNITAGTYGAYFFIENDMTITYNFVASEEEGPGTDEPTGDWTELQLDKTYVANAVGALTLKFTPTANGTLSVIQSNSYDSHFFNYEPKFDDEFGWLLNTPMVPLKDYQDGDVSPYTLPFAVEAGKTYYFVAKLNAYDDISDVLFTWENESDVENTIELNQNKSVKPNEVYKFIAPMTGVLTVNTNKFSTGLAMEPNRQFVLFSNSVCTESVPALAVGASSEFEGYAITFYLEEGAVCYLTNPTIENVTFLLTMEEVGELVPELVNIEPLPGRAYDKTNNKYYINMIFSPANATAEKVEVSYVTNDGNTVTFQSPEFGYNEGAFRIDVRQLTEAMDNNNVKEGSEIKVKLYGVESMGSYLTKSQIVTGVEIGEEGLVTLTYTSERPITLINDVLPRPLYTYGTQQAVLTFSGDVAAVGEVSVVAGRQYWGSAPSTEEPDLNVIIPETNVYIETNTVTVDFTGVDLSELGEGDCTIFVQGVQGINGLYADIDGIAVYQGYTTLSATEVPECTVDHFTPAYGGELELNEDGSATFQVVFTAPAKIELAEAPLAFNIYNCTLEAEDAQNGFATTWNVTIPAAYISLMQEENRGASVNLTVVDQYGNTVINSQSTLYVVVTFTLPESEPGVDFEVAMDQAATGSLNFFTVITPEGYDYIEANNYVNNDAGKDLYESITITDGKNFTAHPVNNGYNEGIVTFSPAITESGTYTISIPYNAFSICVSGSAPEGQGGSEGDIAKASRAKEVQFVVTVSETAGVSFEVVDSSDITVVSLTGVTLIKNGTASDLNSLQPGLYIVNGKKVVIRK